MKYRLYINHQEYLVEKKTDGYYYKDQLLLPMAKVFGDKIQGHSVVTEEGIHLSLDHQDYWVSLEKETDHQEQKTGNGEIRSPLNGVVAEVFCSLEQEVKKGDKLMTIEAMKMLHTLYADSDGRIKELNAQPSISVKSKQLLVKIV